MRLLILMRLLLLAMLFAALGVTGEARAEPARSSDRFGAWRHAVSLSSGYGWGHRLSGSRGDAVETETIPVLPRWSVGLTDVLGGEEAYRGNLEIALEGVFLVNTRPHSGSAQGGDLFLRYNLLAFEPFVPYVGLGGGVLHLDYDLETQRDGFNFVIAGEVGLHVLLGERLAVSGGYRLQHISNARTASPNLAVDTSFATFGITYFLR